MKQQKYSLLFILVASSLLAACSTTGKPVAAVDTGYRVELKQSWADLPNYSRIYFQGGQQLPYKSLDQWSTYCSLYLFNRERQADYLASVDSGNFSIKQVNIYRKSSESSPGSHGLYASVGFRLQKTSSSGLDWERDGPPSYYLYEVEMKLTSADQADLKSLNCAKKWNLRGNFYPTLPEMQRALGTLVTLSAGGA